MEDDPKSRLEEENTLQTGSPEVNICSQITVDKLLPWTLIVQTVITLILPILATINDWGTITTCWLNGSQEKLIIRGRLSHGSMIVPSIISGAVGIISCLLGLFATLKKSRGLYMCSLILLGFLVITNLSLLFGAFYTFGRLDNYKRAIESIPTRSFGQFSSSQGSSSHIQVTIGACQEGNTGNTITVIVFSFVAGLLMILNMILTNQRIQELEGPTFSILISWIIGKLHNLSRYGIEGLSYSVEFTQRAMGVNAVIVRCRQPNEVLFREITVYPRLDTLESVHQSLFRIFGRSSQQVIRSIIKNDSVVFSVEEDVQRIRPGDAFVVEFENKN